jgi:PadR family transcriptional regulator PadR
LLKGEINVNISKELAKGSTPLLVLSLLFKGDMYGYQIIKEMEVRSEFVFSLKEGTLYPILHAMEKEGMLNSYWLDNGKARKRKYYQITKKGIKLFEKDKEAWAAYSTAVNKVIGSEGKAFAL